MTADARIPCEWGAHECQGEPRHLVTIRQYSDRGQLLDVPMCDRCAAIFDPALGASSAFVQQFVAREAW